MVVVACFVFLYWIMEFWIIPFTINCSAVIGATVPAWTRTPRYQPPRFLGSALPSWTQNLYVKIGICRLTSNAPPTAPTAKFSYDDNVVVGTDDEDDLSGVEAANLDGILLIEAEGDAVVEVAVVAVVDMLGAIQRFQKGSTPIFLFALVMLLSTTADVVSCLHIHKQQRSIHQIAAFGGEAKNATKNKHGPSSISILEASKRYALCLAKKMPTPRFARSRAGATCWIDSATCP